MFNKHQFERFVLEQVKRICFEDSSDYILLNFLNLYKIQNIIK